MVQKNLLGCRKYKRKRTEGDCELNTWQRLFQAKKSVPQRNSGEILVFDFGEIEKNCGRKKVFTIVRDSA